MDVVVVVVVVVVVLTYLLTYLLTYCDITHPPNLLTYLLWHYTST